MTVEKSKMKNRKRCAELILPMNLALNNREA